MSVILSTNRGDAVGGVKPKDVVIDCAVVEIVKMRFGECGGGDDDVMVISPIMAISWNEEESVFHPGNEAKTSPTTLPAPPAWE